MENFSADFDSSSIFGGNYFMDELMLPNFSTDEFTSSLPVVYDINGQNNSIIEYIDPTTLTTITTQDDIKYDFTMLENVFETNEIYHNDQAINISEDKSPNLYLNDTFIDNNNILLTNNNHYSNNMTVPEELNHSESLQQIGEIKAESTIEPLKIAAIKDDFNNNAIGLTTPDIANQIFDLVESNKIVLGDEQTELENFDLIEFITSPNGTMTSFDDDDIQEPPTPAKMTTKRKYSEFRETSSTCSSVGSPAPSKKRRGRPPKPLDEIPEIELDDLDDIDLKYLEMRNKNNLASRRSRMNRKHRELKDEAESTKLENEYRKLAQQETELIKECEKWKRAVMRLAAL